jgi:DNA-binding FrmR family transcriptional regulator
MDKAKALSRLRTIEGHIRGIVRMMDEGAYCIDLLHQTSAVQRAIDKLNRDLLESHLQTCVIKALQEGSNPREERVIRELLDIFVASARR